MYKLEGMYAAIPTPFFEDESIYYAGIKTLVGYLADQGLHGIIAGGSTGEYTMMSTEERKGVIKAACEAGMPEERVMRAASIAEALSELEEALGADDAVLVKASHFMGLDRLAEGLVS